MYMRKKIIVFIILALLVVVAGGLCFYKMTPKTFSKLVPEADLTMISCVVSSIDGEELLLEGSDYQTFIQTLEECSYYDEGRHENTLSGYLYHVNFFNTDTNELVKTIIISDESILYVDGKQYRISSEAEDKEKLVEYLEGL